MKFCSFCPGFLRHPERVLVSVNHGRPDLESWRLVTGEGTEVGRRMSLRVSRVEYFPIRVRGPHRVGLDTGYMGSEVCRAPTTDSRLLAPRIG